MNKTEYLAINLHKYMKMLNALRILNRKLFENTELYEKKNTEDYNEELWTIFAKKINYYGRLERQIYEQMAKDEKLLQTYKEIRRTDWIEWNLL